LHNGTCLSETSTFDGKLRSTPILWGGMNWYCRSDLHSLESAATAAQTIHVDPLIISKEAYKACGINSPPFLCGHISDFEKPLNVLHDLNEMLSTLDTKSKKYKEGEEQFLKIRYTLEQFFKLKKII